MEQYDTPLYSISWNHNYTMFRAEAVVPQCTCTYIDVDLADIRGCELCDPKSAYNVADTVQPVAAADEPEPVCSSADDDAPFGIVPRKPMGHEHVAEPFRSILNQFVGGVR